MEEKERVRVRGEKGRSLGLKEVGTTPDTPIAEKVAIGATRPKHKRNGVDLDSGARGRGRTKRRRIGLSVSK